MSGLATVRVRVTAAAVVIVAVALALAGLWLVRAHRNALTHDIEATARQRAQDIASDVADGQFARTVAAPHGDEKFAQVVDANGDVVAASTNVGFGFRISQLTPGGGGWAARTVDHLPAGEAPFRVVARRVDTKGGTYTVYVAQSLEAVEHSTDNLVRLLLVGLPIILMVVGVTTWFVTGRALHPVAAIRQKVESIGASQDLSQRVPESRTHDEIWRLAHTMNAMLARLQLASTQQRRFVDDASHELRSPLTSIRSQLEVDLGHPEQADWRTTAHSVLDDTMRMQRLVDDLLALARVDVRVAVAEREPVDLDEIVLSEARRLRERSTHVVDTSGVSGAQLCGNADDLTRAVRNLFENADRHARWAITVALHECDGHVHLTVADDGPGIPATERARVFERFTRLDEARARDGGGTGLGLAITHDIVTSHGGTITIDDAPGARFAATFPQTSRT